MTAIRDLLERSGLRAPWLAKTLGISHGHLRNILCGYRATPKDLPSKLRQVIRAHEEIFATKSDNTESEK
jgi:plasmid maintenance system antidote protein VapI